MTLAQMVPTAQAILPAALVKLRALYLALRRIHRDPEFPGHFVRAAIPQLRHLLPELLGIRLDIDSLAHRLGPLPSRGSNHYLSS